MLKRFFLFAMLVQGLCLFASGQRLLSPDGKIEVSLHPAGGTDGKAYLTILYDRQEVFRRIGIGLETDRQNLAKGLRIASASAVTPHTDDYMLKSGKRLHCTNQANEQTFVLGNGQGQRLTLQTRAYNDGVAFRYSLHAAPEGETLTAEHTSYGLPEGRPRWMRPRSVDNEGFYPLATDGKQVGEWGYPALMEPQPGVFALLTEADLQRTNCGSFLVSDGTGRYRVQPVERALPVAGEWRSAWHVVMIGPLADIVESTLVTDVSTPCRLEDTDWIRPGVASWIYWAYNHGTRDYQLVKSYIDLAAEMGWRYNLIDWEWDRMANGGKMEDAVAYARSKGIRPLLWYNSSTNWTGDGAPGPLYRLNKAEDREKEFAWLERLGVQGIKVDFFPTDHLQAINYYHDLLEAAARHRLLINLHGGTLPWGWQRTYPNLITLEAVYGAEWYNNNDRLTSRAACHNATLPFTRNVIGPMDYTPGTFSNSQHSHITTHAHELALPFLFESGIQHMPDRPETYRSLPPVVKRLLSGLPTAWDDTRLLAGYPGESVVMARRKGKTWYIAGINGKDTAATLRFSLERLALSPQAKALLAGDGKDSQSFRIDEDYAFGKTVQLDCLPRGGFLLMIND